MKEIQLLSVAVLSSLLAVGCATVDIEKPVGQFAQATKAAGEAVDRQNRAITDYLQDIGRTEAVKLPHGVRFKDDSCMAGSSECAVVFYKSQADAQAGNGVLLSDAPELEQIPQLMTQISTYAANLDALAKADSTASVKSSLDATVGSISNIAKTVSSYPNAHQQIQQIGEPAANIASWFTGQYLNKLKTDGLSKATTGADPLIKETVGILKSVEQQLVFASQAQFAETVSKSRDNFAADPNRKSLDELIQSAHAYEQFLNASKKSVFDAMATAHESLANALSSEDKDLSEALADIQYFLSQANQLKDMSEELVVAIKNGGQP